MQKGDFIRFRYTGDRGKITGLRADGTFDVLLLDDDIESLAWPEDIVLESDFKRIEESEEQKSSSKKKKPRQLSTEEQYFGVEELKKYKLEELRDTQKPAQHKPPVEEEPDTEAKAFKKLNPQPPQNSGLHLALWEQRQGMYGIFLINDSLTSLSFSFELALKELPIHRLEKQILPNDFFAVGEISRAQLNDRPRMEIRFPLLNFDKRIKLRIKQMLGNKRSVPLMGVEAHHYSLVKEVRPIKKSNKLKKYTEIWADSIPDDRPYRVHIYDVEERARFPQAIDLHLDKLADNPEEVLDQDYLGFKMENLERYINNALRLGVPEVFVIHGVGKGFLREQVHRFLDKHPHVERYINEYFQKYGFGATKVIFK